MAQKTRGRKAEEEEPEQLDEQSEEFDEDPEGFEEDGDQLGFRLKEDAVEIDLPRDGNEGKNLHAIAEMLDAIAS
jgi:hypothetical protein